MKSVDWATHWVQLSSTVVFFHPYVSTLNLIVSPAQWQPFEMVPLQRLNRAQQYQLSMNFTWWSSSGC